MPSLPTVVRMGGLQLALNAFLDAHGVVRLWRTARPFRALRVVHLRIVDDGPAGARVSSSRVAFVRWRWSIATCGRSSWSTCAAPFAQGGC